jgi:hypothetical protein
MIHGHSHLQSPNLLDGSWCARASHGHVVESDGVIIIAYPDSWFDAAFVAPGEVERRQKDGIVDGTGEDGFELPREVGARYAAT